MHRELVFVLCATVALILVSTTEARGRGGGGRGGGRSGGRSSSRGGFFGSRSSSSSSIGKSSSIGSSHHGTHSNGGWAHGFFYSTPYRYNYRPIYISRSSTHTGSYHVPNKEEEEVADHNKDTGNYAIGYSISKALSNDFFSIFNVVHDISKYPEKIRNKELTTTTTQSPVSTYDLNYIINPTYTRTSTTYENDPKSYFLDDDTLFGMMTSKKSEENKDSIPKDYDGIQNSGSSSFDTVSDDISIESTTTYYQSKDDTHFNTKLNYDDNDSVQKILKEIESSIAGYDNISEDAPTERNMKKVSTQTSSESIDEMVKELQANINSFKLF